MEYLIIILFVIVIAIVLSRYRIRIGGNVSDFQFRLDRIDAMPGEDKDARDQNFKYWNDLVMEDKRLFGKMENVDGQIMLDGSPSPIQFRAMPKQMIEGIASLEKIFDERPDAYELYMASAGRVIDGVYAPEMYVSLSTNAESPLVMHFGINRSVVGMIALKRAGYGATPLSLKLHAFGARALQQIYKNKYYLISAPVKSMRDILIKAFGDDVYHISSDRPLTEAQQSQIDELQKESKAVLDKRNQNNDKIKLLQDITEENFDEIAETFPVLKDAEDVEEKIFECISELQTESKRLTKESFSLRQKSTNLLISFKTPVDRNDDRMTVWDLERKNKLADIDKTEPRYAWLNNYHLNFVLANPTIYIPYSVLIKTA